MAKHAPVNLIVVELEVDKKLRVDLILNDRHLIHFHICHYIISTWKLYFQEKKLGCFVLSHSHSLFYLLLL